MSKKSNQTVRASRKSRQQWQQQLLTSSIKVLDQHSAEKTNHRKSKRRWTKSATNTSNRLPWEERREQLLETAERLFAQGGYSGTTCREVAEAAGVSQAIIFFHFPTKEDLYSSIIRRKMLKAEAAFRAALEEAARCEDDHALFQTLALHILDYFRTDPEYLRLLVFCGLEGHELATQFIKQQSQPLSHFVTGYIRQRIKDGAFRRVHPATAARAFLGMAYNHAFVMTLHDDPALPIGPEEPDDGFVDIFLQGILNRSSDRPPFAVKADEDRERKIGWLDQSP